MNYKVSSIFIKLQERNGLIENNGAGIIEFAITENGVAPIENDKSNQLIKPNGKLVFKLEDNQTAYVRAITHVFSSKINVLEVNEDEIGCDIDDRLISVDEAQSIINKYI